MTQSYKPNRIYFFYTIAFTFPLVLFVLLEVGLTYFEYGDNLDLFIEAPKDYGNEGYWMNNPIVAERYFPKGSYMPRPAQELFRKNKPGNGYRIFVMGGSTAATYPYSSNMLFSRILSQRLSDAFPEKYIEVVNTGIAAVNSFTLLDFIDEILEYEPDAILIYAGHNEFYGAFGAASSRFLGRSRWLVNFYFKLMRLKTVQLVRNTMQNLELMLRKSSQEPNETLMGRMVGDPSIPYGNDVYQAAKANFEANLRDIVTAAQGMGVKVVLSELVSNTRDHPPFVSVDDGVHLPADVVYAWAQMLEQEKMYDMARETYAWAKDLDGLRFRAPEEFNEVIRRLAGELNVPIVPMKSYFEKSSSHGLIGNNLMLEHLHPNVEGYFLISEGFFDAIRHHELIGNWENREILPASFYQRVWPITDFDRALGYIRIIHLTDHWPYPPKKEGESTIAKFKPRDETEALAFKFFMGEISFIQARIELSKHYDERAMHEHATREYQALVAAEPYNIDVTLLTIRRLLKAKAYDSAFPLLMASREIKNTAYANKWIGFIFVQRGHPEQAVPYLEEARSLTPEDTKLIAALGMAYLMSGQLISAEAMLKELKSAAPESADVTRLLTSIEQHKQKTK